MIANARITRRLAVFSLLTAPLWSKSALASKWPLMTVYKDPNCGCCRGWVAHLAQHGFAVKTVDTDKLNDIKTMLGVPGELMSCHTAEIAGYLVEGHVPAAAIERFLNERPKATGLAVPGMPGGSPGMSGVPEEYQVILFGRDERRSYGTFKGDRQV